MERTIDRTSYRRSARYVEKEIPEKTNNKFGILNMFFNQVIVSLLIIILAFAIDYYDINFAREWITENIGNGYEMSELFSILKNKFNKEKGFKLIDFSGDLAVASGDTSSGENDVSGDKSGESGELISAVEGVNQMSDDASAIKNNYDLLLPVNGVITSNFGCRVSNNSVVSTYHTGLDIGANSGTNILAAHDGRVTLAKNFSSYGKCVTIESEDGELVTLYAHCSSLNVSEGQKVQKGAVIGKVGMTGNATGPHLHLEIRYNGRFVDPKAIYGEI